MPQQIFRDDPRNWKDVYSKAPSNFDVAAYQQRIDAITGTVNGKSIIRVVWGGEHEMQIAKEVTSLGTATELVKVGMHRTRVKGVPGKVRIKRWIFEEYQAPAQIPQDMFVRMPHASGLYLPPQMVQERIHGRYEKWYPACDHSKCLKEDCESTDYFCFGDYREPDERDLQKIARITQKRLQMSHADPLSPISEWWREQWEREAMAEVNEKERKEQESLDEFYDDAKKIMSRVTTSG